MGYSSKIDDKDIEVVKEFKYLGVLFSRADHFMLLKSISLTKPKKRYLI